MDFVYLEKKGKEVLEQYPFIKRSFKRIYQLSMYAISKEKFKAQGNIIRVSPNDDYEYFYGYYDKSPWDKSDRYMLCLRVKQAYKSVAPKEEAEIVIIDTQDDNKVIKLAKTNSWNVQQGCMAQWLGPDYSERIIYNDFRNGNYCSVIFNVKLNKEEKVLSLPVYDVSRDGKFALSLDFSRLHRLRKGYGYSNIEDKTINELCPDKTCIWRINIDTNEIEELLKYTDFANFEVNNTMIDAEHKVNHIMISPNGKRFMVLHRWFKNGRKNTRLVTVNCDGTDMYNLSDDIFVSHCYWKNDSEILSFLRKKESGDHYYLIRDRTKEYKMLWNELDTDGHCSYSPNNNLIITDTYPNRKRLAYVFLCKENGEIKRIASVFAPFRYDNEVRCDLHPRWNWNGDKVCIDSVHEGKRQIYIIPIEEKSFHKIKEKEVNKNIDKKTKVAVLLATYNGEKYLEEQIESLRKQKNVEVSILVRDDCSTDDTIKILKKYEKNNILKWYTGEHLNVCNGFLNLISNAPDADYYAFCDQDDVWDENKLEVAIRELKKMDSKKPALYYSSLRLVDENLKFLSNHILNIRRNNMTSYVISNIAGCTAVFNRTLLKKVRQYNPEYILMHDGWIYKICVALGGSIYVDETPHISYRQHNNNVVGLHKGLKAEFEKIKKYIYKFEIQKQMYSLYKGYSNEMLPEYKELTEQICNYDRSIIDKIKLLRNKNINFKNRGLNIIYKLKIIFNKL